MLTMPPTVRVYLAPGATDMRKSFDGLMHLARQAIGQDPLSGHLFAFCNRGKNRLKILFWDGSGLWVLAKRLEKGTFQWPRAAEGQTSVQLTSQELALILDGVDLSEAVRRPWWRTEHKAG